MQLKKVNGNTKFAKMAKNTMKFLRENRMYADYPDKICKDCPERYTRITSNYVECCCTIFLQPNGAINHQIAFKWNK